MGRSGDGKRNILWGWPKHKNNPDGWTESLSVAVSRQRTADSALITKTSVISSGINTHSYSS